VAGLRAAGVQPPGTDRYLAPEIETAVGYVATGGAVRAAETVIGPLQ
jgi:histidine ammonia-lyase